MWRLAHAHETLSALRAASVTVAARYYSWPHAHYPRRIRTARLPTREWAVPTALQARCMLRCVANRVTTALHAALRCKPRCCADALTPARRVPTHDGRDRHAADEVDEDDEELPRVREHAQVVDHIPPATARRVAAAGETTSRNAAQHGAAGRVPRLAPRRPTFVAARCNAGRS